MSKNDTDLDEIVNFVNGKGYTGGDNDLRGMIKAYADWLIGKDDPIQPLTVKLSKAHRYATFQKNKLRAEQRQRNESGE